MSEQIVNKKVKINNEGYLESLDITDATIEVEVDLDTYYTLLSVKNGYNWQYKNNVWTEVPLLAEKNLRALRKTNCFRLIDNKSQLWWNRLTKVQLNELEIWYDAWLKVTDTKIIPDKPEWLK